MNLFDKQAQRERAKQVSAELAAQGVPAPKLIWPVPAPPPQPTLAQTATAAVKIARKNREVLDMRGKRIEIGDEIVYSTYKGAALHFARVIGFSQSKKSVKIMTKPYSWRPEKETYKTAARIAKVG